MEKKVNGREATIAANKDTATATTATATTTKTAVTTSAAACCCVYCKERIKNITAKNILLVIFLILHILFLLTTFLLLFNQSSDSPTIFLVLQ